MARRRNQRSGRGPAKATQPPRRAAGAAEARRLVHELEVHQAELEQQNEELRAARAEIEAGLARSTELFDFAPIGYFVLGEDGGIREANFAAARLLGVERRRLAGRKLAAFVARRDADAFHRFVREVIAQRGASTACELLLVAQPGGVLEVRLTSVALAGAPGTVLVAVEDVTDRRRAERALRDETRRKDEFLAALSHELRNPLAPLRNALALLARLPASSEQARRAVAVVERQVCHLGRIVDDLLDVTRVTRGKIQLRRERAELGELLRRTVEDHRATFDAAGVELGLDLPGAPCWVDVDPTRVAQALGNLLENAVKFTARGGAARLVLRRDGAGCAVTIRDTGEGIAPDVRARLFEPFAQGTQALDRGRGGLGLGLALVKALVELHGGTVAAEARAQGEGAAFTVRLPTVAPPPRARADAGAGVAPRLRVLVIDDNEDGAATLAECLALDGHDVRTAVDGPSGLALARRFAPDVVICDIGLPGMDGYEVARALRADGATRGVHLVALSGYAHPDDLRRAREAGFDQHLAKPLGIDALERVLGAAPASPHAEPPPSVQ